VKEEEAGLIDGVMQIVLQAAFFFARGRDEGTDLSLEQQLLTFLGAEDNDESDRVFGEFAGFQLVRRLFGALTRVRLFRFSFGHTGRDCIAVGGVCKAYSRVDPRECRDRGLVLHLRRLRGIDLYLALARWANFFRASGAGMGLRSALLSK
jgi:hypothetical protein